MRYFTFVEQFADGFKTLFGVKIHGRYLRMEVNEDGVSGQISKHLPQHSGANTRLSERLPHGKSFELDAMFRKAPSRGSGRQTIHPGKVMMAFCFMFIVFFIFGHSLFHHEYLAADGKNLF